MICWYIAFVARTDVFVVMNLRVSSSCSVYSEMLV